MAKGHPFAMLASDFEAVGRLPSPPLARELHDPAFDGEEISIDFAPLLGMEPAPHRVVVFADLSAATFYRMRQDAEELRMRFMLQGWNEAMCADVAMLCAMHKTPSVDGSGRALVDIWGLVASRAKFRGLFMHVLERIGRAFPETVRPELRLEIIAVDLQVAHLEATRKAMAEGADLPEPPTQQDIINRINGDSLLPPGQSSPKS